SVLSDAGVSIIHTRLLDFLGPQLPPHSLGRCVWEDGRLISDYQTIYFRDTFTMRGDAKTSYFKCGTCGFIGTVAFNPYALRGELGGGSIFIDEIFCLYLSEDLNRRFPWREFPDLQPVMITVRDTPLPDDPYPINGAEAHTVE